MLLTRRREEGARPVRHVVERRPGTKERAAQSHGAEAAAAGWVREGELMHRPQRVIQPARGVPPQREGEAGVGAGREGGSVRVAGTTDT